MPPPTLFHITLQSPRLTLLSLFLLTRLVYFTVALLTPSPAYDSSTNLILPAQDASGHVGICWSLLTKLAERLTRWDALYFVKVAERGYLREQEWAFGLGWARVMGTVGRVIIYISPVNIPSPYPYILGGVLIANLSHLLSVLTLYSLTKLTYPAGEMVAFVASAMHVLSPAGIFLAAPYSESLFALLSFLGYYLYVQSTHAYYSPGNSLGHVGFVMGAGALWMLAGMVRSNGVLNGLVVLADFVKEGWTLLRGLRRGPEAEVRDSGDRISVMRRLARIAGLGVAGGMVGLGLIVPQVIAWMQFCAGDGEGGRGVVGQREWCSRTVPSIYLYVQDKYWNVGFLRYWIPGNIPLFLLAAPILYILTRSAWSMLNDTPSPSTISQPASVSKPLSTPTAHTHDINASLIRAFALPQLTLAILALTSYHVQIINRLSSGYVVWYWWLAQTILCAEEGSERRKAGRRAVRWCVGYALVQGVLFAGFLPPA
ncbi:GPI mannosyltransferase 2 [Tirmania nivea]|nr:GPI mannosyltransferase 2 [Tirmania nivea]